MYFKILEKYLKENLSENNQTIRDFLIPSLAKFLSQYSAFKGFLNFDIVMNEDNRFEFQCSHNKVFLIVLFVAKLLYIFNKLQNI